ncbi:MAG: zinc ribbon domain-containing protein [Muribaculaceae bacterium]|nr:zinc ribbon domain-containing protein [Muribaculaceae bacterium]
MSKITCPNCGNTVPEGSAFCNRCGSRIETENYRNDRRNDRDDDWNSNRTSKLEQRQNSRDNNKGNGLTKYIIIGLAIAAFAALFFITRCNKTDRVAHPVSTVDESAAACADTLQRALNDYNYVGDGARIVYASRVTGSQPGTNDVIVGITQKTGEFYKIYKLTKQDGKWIIDPENIKQISTAGYDVTFDQDKMMAGRDIIPQVVDIGGKKYFFYAFMQTPSGDPSRAQVVLNMYDVETRAITTATYEGEFQNINSERVILCNPATGSSEVVKWMNETARNFIRIVRFQGEEQQAEEEQKQEEEKPAEEEQKQEEVKPEQPENSAVTEVKDKDDAMFKIDDVTKTVRAGNFKVMLLKDGSVVSYNTATGQNSKIHSGGAKDIGFYDTANGIISIRNNDDTRKRVNLNNGQIVNTEAAPQPKKEEEPKKDEPKKDEPKKEG